jgi:hypothetical protein
MIVLFPDPDDPTMAVVLPFSNFNEKSSKIFYSFLEGYENETFLNSISP